MNGRGWPVVVRLARPSDREAVLSFATTTWGGWDYIPDVWDRWIGASDGIVLVAAPAAAPGGGAPTAADGTPLDADRPVAFARVALLSRDEAWFEGIRVDPKVRGQAVATDLQVAELHWAHAHGARVVRYATASDNEASHRLGARHGFRFVGAWRSYGGEDDAASEDREQAPLDRAGLLRATREAGLLVDRVERPAALLERDPTVRAGRGLYEARAWSVQELARERVDAHARCGELVGWPDTRDPRAVGILPLSALAPDESELHVAALAGDPDHALGLLRALRDATGAEVRVRLPDPDPPLLEGRLSAWAEAGLAPHDYLMHILERPLDGDEPLPEPDSPGSLWYGDEPRPIATPPPIG